MYKKLAATLIAGTAILLTSGGISAASASTLTGEATVTPAATCVVCSVEIYPGGGKEAVKEPPLPAVGDIGISTAPVRVEIHDPMVPADNATLKMDDPSLEGAYGDCGSDCSDWAVYHNGFVQVTSFSWVSIAFTVTGHYLGVPAGNSNWKDEGNGLYTPVYFYWWTVTTPNPTYYCAHLNLTTRDWSVILQGATPTNCP